ncbi:MAG: WbqC family protein [Synergistales bacterium]|nr:WbqC family protein [Synergistales bacterium]
MNKKAIAILQSNYIPWKGNFDMINMVDEYVILDDVQYTKRDWRNRNRIITRDGIMWLTIPVKNKSFQQKIMDTQIVSDDWAERHWRLVEQSYGKAPFFPGLENSIRHMYEKASMEIYLSRINYIFLEGICRLMRIPTPLRWSVDFEPKGEKSARILHICVKAGAGEYLSGPAAKDYLDLQAFEEKGISLRWMCYEGYPEYEQLHGYPFSHNVSILDLLFCTGVEGAKRKMLSFR